MTRTPPGTPEALATLAAHCGIASTYHDIWGKSHATADTTLRAVLKAMRLPVDDDPAEVLRQLEEREWRRVLPPVLVLRQGEPIPVPVSLPSSQASCRHQWILTAETGATTSGVFVPKELNRIGEQRLGKKPYVRGELVLPALAEIGYYRLEVEQLGQEAMPQAVMALAIAPHVCYQPEATSEGGRIWGLTVQLYGLRSRQNWGIGDFSDLRNMVDLAAEAGAGVVGVSPLHDLFPDEPERVSPYSPSSRCFVNTLFIDVEAIPEFAECKAAQSLV